MLNIFNKVSNKSKQLCKSLDATYDYYGSIRNKTNLLYEKYCLTKYTNNPNKKFYKIPMNDEIAIEIFYNINLNLCNQVVYDYSYNFTQNDLFFIVEFRIDDILDDIMNIFTNDIAKMREIENNSY